LLIFVVFFTACNGKKDDKKNAVARVFDNYLYEEDLKEAMPANISKGDSAAFASEYIDNWIQHQLLVAKADKNLSGDEKDFSKELEDYKNSLLIYKYESQLVQQNIDTTVTEEDITKYYDANKKDFQLKENIVKVLYVKLPRKISTALPRQWLNSSNTADRNRLQDFCVKNAVNYYLDDESWLFFNDILKEIPINTYNQEEYLKNNRLIELQDSTYSYLMNIKGFMIKDGLSPLSFERNNIRNLILNKRKMKLIDDMKNQIYQDAVKGGDFEILKK
jgi:hypothetical protein